MTLLKTVLTAFAAVSVILAALPASAQASRPGLWEVTSKVGGNAEMDKAMAKMQQQMANMPADQRKMMEDMLAKQGVGMGSGGGGFSAKICMTKEMSDRNQLPVQQQGDCKTTLSDKTATGMKMVFTCTNPPSSGEGQFTFNGDTAYSMKMKLSSNVQGKPQSTLIEGSGKFLTADCGNIKPMVLPPVGK